MTDVGSFMGSARFPSAKAQTTLTDQASGRRTAVGRGSFFRPTRHIGFPSGSCASALAGLLGGRTCPRRYEHVTDSPRRARAGGQSDE